MTRDIRKLLDEARQSLHVAIEMRDGGYYGYCTSRAYYAMYHAAQVLLETKQIPSSSHREVHAALGREFVARGEFPRHLHQALVRGMDLRHRGDYLSGELVELEEAEQLLVLAAEFIEAVTRMTDSE